MNIILSQKNRQRVTILHTADLHLKGSKEGVTGDGPPRFDDSCTILKALIDTANQLCIDLVLIAGDLFDDYHPSKRFVSSVLDELSRLEPPTIIIPGNHDCLDNSDTFTGSDWTTKDMHPYVITNPPGEILEAPGLPVIVWGRAMEQHTSFFEPLAGLPCRNEGAWHIAMGHGFYYGEGESGHRSSPIYANQILHSNWDYFALGHTHFHTDVSQGRIKAAYSGSPLPAWNPNAEVLLIDLDGLRNEPVFVNRLSLFIVGR
ncbi:MAG: metallophosphoesterase [Thermodesulfobacteriota bacterium]|nr:metallophosphoesterase [Thermodesulfobacteriota bacterium]